MKSRVLRIAALVPVAAFLVLATGCFKFQEELVLMPDGSGKVVLTFRLNLEMLDKFKESMGGESKEMDEQMEFTAEDVENAEGIVAFTKPAYGKKDGWRTVTFTGYFEDINKVKFWNKKEDKKTMQASFSFRKEGEGHVLEIDDRFMVNDDMKMDEMPEEGKEQAWGMIKDFLKGFEISRGVRMPGPVTSVEGFDSKEGRSAANKVTGETLKDLADVAKVMKAVKRKVVSGKSDLSEGDVAAFKKELEAAKAAWPKIKEEMKAEAEKKKKQEEEK